MQNSWQLVIIIIIIIIKTTADYMIVYSLQVLFPMISHLISTTSAGVKRVKKMLILILLVVTQLQSYL